MTLPQAQPLYFGPEERPLFGWLHAPRPGTASGLGLIICNPFGYEAICAHRSIRHFADAAARAGIPALRFDYDGVGDSAGTDLDSARVPAWLKSIQLAADTLRELTGVERLCFMGLRLGATLASLAAAERTDVEALMALAPVVSAKAHLRELRALQLVMKRNEESQKQSDGILETAGFLLTPDTQAALSDIIDLHRLDRAPAPRVLVMDRTDVPGNERWAEHLRTLGACVERRDFQGYVEMMLDSHESVIPQQTIDSSMQWLASIASSRSVPSLPSPAPQVKAREGGQRVRIDPTVDETAVRFGDNSILFGILSTPSEANQRSGKTVLLLNSGAVHHVGPNRLYVMLARRWAAIGHTVLRMDLSGLGDSATRPGEEENVVYSSRAGEDVRAALDYLRREHPANHCHALGLCSGAYHSFKAAVAGQPLAGVMVINPLTFFWKEGMSLKYPEYRIAADVVRYRKNVWRLESWRKLFSGKVNLWELSQVLLRRMRTVTTSRIRSFLGAVGVPLPDDLRRELKTVAKQRVDMLFVFADKDPGLELLRVQGGSTVKRLKSRHRLDIRIIPGANHTFTDRATRTQLAEILTEKLK